MLSNRTALWGVVCLASFAAAASAQTDRIAVVPAAGSGSTVTPIYNTSPFTLYNNVPTPAGAFQIIPKPDGSKFYVISNSASAPITVYDQNFNNAHAIAGSIQTAPTLAAISPDGKRLLVAANNLFIIDTSTDSIVNGNGFPIPAGKAVDIAFSIDSTSAYLLSASTGFAQVTQINLITNTVGSSFTQTVNNLPTGLTMAPNGLLYLTSQYRIYELDPRTLLQTAASAATPIGVLGTPGKPVFTPDGQYAIMANLQPSGANSSAIFVLNLTNRTVTTFPSAGNIAGLVFDTIVPLGSNRVLLFSSQTPGSLYELTLANGLNIVQSQLTGAITAGTLNSFAASAEVPAQINGVAQNLYVTGTSGSQLNLYKLDLTSNSLIGQTTVPAQTGQNLEWIGVNPTSGAATIEATSTTSQVVQPGTYSLPLVVRVLDANNRPVFGATVTFTASTGVTLTSATASTNADGFAETYALTPASGGQLSVQAASGNLTPVNFTLQAIGSGGGGGGNSSGAASVSIVQGNGQLVIASQNATQQMVIQVNDVNGNPAANVPVTFSITQGSGTINCGGDFQDGTVCPSGAQQGTTVSMFTNTAGQAGVQFLGSAVSPGNSYLQTTISAGPNITGVNNASFVITSIPGAPPSGIGYPPIPLVTLIAPVLTTSGRIVTGGAGQVITGAIQIQVVSIAGAQQGQGVPNVALNVSGLSGTSAPYATCNGGTPLTDANGFATCDLVMGNVVSTTPTPLNVNVGNAVNTPTIDIVVNQGPPSKITVIQGNNQTGKPGAAVSLPLVGLVTDSAGTPIANASVTWKVTKGSATLSNSSTTTDTNGRATTNVTFGQTAGTVQVTLTAGSGTGAPSVTFTLTSSVPFGSMTGVSGSGQTAIVSTQFSQPLIVLVKDNTGNPLPGVPVTFAVTSGSASVGTTNATTNSQGQASTNVTAGVNAGAIVVTASSNNTTVTFNLTSQLPPPSVTPTSFQNAASGAVGLTPCGIATVTGNGLVPGINGIIQANTYVGPLPTTLGPVGNLQINGVSAPIFWVANINGTQTIAFQVPCETPVGTSNVAVTVNGNTNTIQGVTVAQYQPGVFTYQASNGKTYAVLLHADGSYVTPSNPAHPGESVTLFATGLGQPNPATQTGRAGIPGQALDPSQLVIGVNNSGVPVTAASYLPGSVGIYTVTFTVPTGTPNGNINLALAASSGGNLLFGNGTLIPVSQ